MLFATSPRAPDKTRPKINSGPIALRAHGGSSLLHNMINCGSVWSINTATVMIEDNAEEKWLIKVIFV